MRQLSLIFLILFSSCSLIVKVDDNKLHPWVGKRKDQLLRHPAWIFPKEINDQQISYIKKSVAWYVKNPTDNSVAVNVECDITFKLKKNVIVATHVKQRCMSYEHILP